MVKKLESCVETIKSMHNDEEKRLQSLQVLQMTSNKMHNIYQMFFFITNLRYSQTCTQNEDICYIIEGFDHFAIDVQFKLHALFGRRGKFNHFITFMSRWNFFRGPKDFQGIILAHISIWITSSQGFQEMSWARGNSLALKTYQYTLITLLNSLVAYRGTRYQESIIFHLIMGVLVYGGHSSYVLQSF